jgi:hypothetical protein
MQDNSPTPLREVYFAAWQKNLLQQPLTPMESILVDVIQRHPEYHALFNNEQFSELKEEKFDLDHNPFLHLGLHVAIIEQVSINKPTGVRPIYQKLLRKYQDKTEVEHQMMHCLVEQIFQLSKFNKPFNENKYIADLRSLK